MVALAKRKLTIPMIRAMYPGQREGRGLAASTVTRWILTGCTATDGSIVKLKATRIGYRWMIDEDDLQAFFDALGGREVDDMPRTPTERHRNSEAASRELEKIGA